MVSQRALSLCLIRIKRRTGYEMTTDKEPYGDEEELFRVRCSCIQPGTVTVTVNTNQPQQVAGSFEDVERICKQYFEKELVEYERGRQVA